MTLDIRRIWILPLAAAIGGCASTPEVRGLAEGTGVYVTSLKKGTAEFVAAQNRLNAENEAHLQRLGADAARFRAQVARQRMAWTSGGETRALDTQALASQVTAADVVGGLRVRAVKPAAVRFEGGKGYDDAADALVAIGTKPDLIAVLRGLAELAGEVEGSFDELSEKAKQDSAATDTKTENADDKAAGLAETAAVPNP